MPPDYPIVDVHVHLMPAGFPPPEAIARRYASRPDAQLIAEISADPDRFVRHLDSIGVEKAAIINAVVPAVFGITEEINDYAARFAHPHPDRIIPFGGIDPRRVGDPAAEVERMVNELGIRGIKIHPPHQHLYANAYRDGGNIPGLAAVYETAQALGVPVMVHTGTSVFPNARNVYADPIYLDDVCVDFPKLKLILAHGGRPIWMETALFILRRHPNTFLDISSIPPQNLLNYFPWLEQLAGRAMFGSDWPGPGVPDIPGNVEKFLALPLSDQAKRQILRETALTLFK